MSEDTWCSGIFLPKGSLILANVWVMNRDPKLSGPDAHEFNPTRYLDDVSGKLKPALPDTLDQGQLTYGFGCRVCPGRHVANSSLFIIVVTTLWAMKIEKARDVNGQDVIPNVDARVNDGLVV